MVFNCLYKCIYIPRYTNAIGSVYIMLLVFIWLQDWLLGISQLILFCHHCLCCSGKRGLCVWECHSPRKQPATCTDWPQGSTPRVILWTLKYFLFETCYFSQPPCVHWIDSFTKRTQLSSDPEPCFPWVCPRAPLSEILCILPASFHHHSKWRGISLSTSRKLGNSVPLLSFLI